MERKAELATRRLTWLVRRGEAELGVQLRSIWSAYDVFCTWRVGLAGQKVLDALGYPGREELFAAVERFKSSETDDEPSERYGAVLCQVWERRFGDEAVGS